MRTILVSLALLGAAAHAEDPAPPPEAAEDLPPLLQEPELVEFVQAPYPETAQAAGVEGEVLLLIELDEAGTVTFVEVLQGVGHGLDPTFGRCGLCAGRRGRSGAIACPSSNFTGSAARRFQARSLNSRYRHSGRLAARWTALAWQNAP